MISNSNKRFTRLGAVKLSLLALIMLAIGVFAFMRLTGNPDSYRDTTVTVVSSFKGKPLGNQAITVWSSTGIRCVAPPCSELNSKTLDVMTDSEGQFVIPADFMQSEITVVVDELRSKLDVFYPVPGEDSYEVRISVFPR